MIGVVVWSSLERQKAVIWCEDQGALAYLHGQENLLSGCAWPDAGDLLELESETVGDLRIARAVTTLNQRHCVDLPAMLKDVIAEEPPLRLVVSEGKRIDRPGSQDRGDARRVMLRRIAACGS